MIRRQWIAQCDEPGCTASEILEGDQSDGKWELGMQVNDHGWWAMPSSRPTYCPEHAGPHFAARDAAHDALWGS